MKLSVSQVSVKARWEENVYNSPYRTKVHNSIPQRQGMSELESWRILGMRKTGPSHTMSIVPDPG